MIQNSPRASNILNGCSETACTGTNISSTQAQTTRKKRFNKTEAAVFSFRPCFLRASLSSV